MGKFTHCCIVTGTTAEALASFYESSGMQAFIFQDRRRRCAVCDDDDEADLDLVAQLTARFQTAALLGQILDSSVFVGTIYNREVAVDEYIDYPDSLFAYIDEDSVSNVNRALSIEQRAAEWATLFDARNTSEILADVFRRRDEYVFAEEFFAALLEALKLPTVLVGADCSDVERIYNVDPVAQKMFRHAGSGGVEEDWD